MRSGNADSAKLAWSVCSPYAAHMRMIVIPAQQTVSAHVLCYHGAHENCTTVLAHIHGARLAILRRITCALADSNAYSTHSTRMKTHALRSRRFLCASTAHPLRTRHFLYKHLQLRQMLHSCGRHYGGQIAGAQQCHPYASYAS